MRRILRTMGLVLPLMTAPTMVGAGDHDIGDWKVILDTGAPD